MATYSQDFAGYTLGAFPTGWTNQWGAWSPTVETGGADQVLRSSPSTDARRALAYDSAGTFTDGQVLARFQISGATFSGDKTLARLGARISGSSGSETGIFLTAGYYDSALGADGVGTQINLGEYNGGSFSALGFSAITIQQGVWYFARLVFDGSNVDLYLWADGASEPGTPTSTVTTSVTGSGAAGLGNFTGEGTQDYDYISFATTSAETAPAPSAPSDTTAPTLTSPTGSSTGSTTAGGSVSTDEGNGTLYWVVSTSASAPSVAQIQAGQDSTGAAAAASGSQAVSATGTQNVSASGLTDTTAYYFHFQQQDGATNDSTVASSTSFTTGSTDTTAPVFSSAATNAAGGSITVTFNEALDTANDTAAGEWTVNVNGSAVTLNAAAIDTGSTTDVVLTLAAAVSGFDAITVSYSGTSLRDAAGNSVASFTGNAATNNVTPAISITLVDQSDVAQASLVNLSWAWFDQAEPGLLAAPTDKGTAESTDGSGALAVDLPNTALTKGQTGVLVVFSDNSAKTGAYPVTV